jgi:4-amino-4-deoxy-L-arabinose transferase-like glycosyltransferase
MDACVFGVPKGPKLLLGLLLVVATLPRLYHFNAPLLDRLYLKQVYEANHARNIARPPLNPLRASLDFLNETGGRMELTEEVPLFNALLGATYVLVGEHEWLGRIWSLLATLVAIVALYDLIRREYDAKTALMAAASFALTPLLIFYSRTVIPDPWMMAFMLLCAGFYRRYLDEGESRRWLIAAAVAGLLGAIFKYYGLLILVPLADMAYRRGGWRSWFSARFLMLGAAMTLPIIVWIVGVFLRVPNPMSRTDYLVWQDPAALFNQRLYTRVIVGLLFQDCGPVTAALIAGGMLAALLGKNRSRPLWGWSMMGLCFWFLFAPKLLEHDYYELVILPVLAGWAALGWRAAERVMERRGVSTRWTGAALLTLAMVIHSPWVLGAKYDLEIGHLIVGERLKQICPPTSRVIVMGQQSGWPEIHYSRRQGWVVTSAKLPANWRETFRKYRGLGAEYAAVYFDPTVLPRVRATYAPLLASLPIVEHRSGPWFTRHRSSEYYILDLRDLDREPGHQAGLAVATPANATR